MGGVNVEWGRSIKEALIFGTRLRRFLPYFIADVTAVALGLCYFLMNADLVVQYSLLLESGASPPPELASVFVPLVLLFFIWYLARVYIESAVMKQVLNPKPKDFGKCWTEAKKIYPVFLATAIIVDVVITAVSMIGGIIGDALTIIATLLLLFSLPAIIVDKKSIRKSIGKSIDIFKKNWAYVLFSWLFISLVSIVISIIAAAPGIVLFLEAILQFLTAGTIDADILFYMIQNPLMLIICGLVFMTGWSIVSAVKANLLVTFYTKLKK